jgi:glycosyltransferase involved in cell wall biosynthesis
MFMETLTFLMTSTFYPPLHIGGDAVFVRNLATLLSEKGHEIHVIFSPGAYQLKRGTDSLNNDVAPSDVFLHPLHKSIIPPIWAYITGKTRGISKIEKIVREVKPDVIHHHNISLIGADVLKLTPEICSLYTAHDFWLICPLNDWRCSNICSPLKCLLCSIKRKRPPQIWRFKRIYKKMDNMAIISPSMFYKNIFSRYGIHSVYLPNFVLPEMRAQRWERSLIYVGILEPHKGIKEVAEFFSENAPDGWKLKIVGNGSLSPYLASLKGVEYLGYLDRDALRMERAKSAFTILLSKWNENCPLSILEGFSQGIPAIVSHRGGLPELVADGSGIALKKLEELKMLENLDEENIKKMREKAYCAWRDKFSPDVHYDNYMKIINSYK